MKMLKKVGALVGALTMLVGTVGCSNNKAVEPVPTEGNGSAQATTDTSKEAVELRFIVSNDEPNLIRAVEEFETLNPNIKINLETIPWKQFFEKVETLIAGNRTPDLLYTPILATKRYAELGSLLDVSDLYDEADLKDFTASSLTTVEMDGKYYGVPHFSDDIAIFYNKDMFEKAGVAVPTSIDETWDWNGFVEATKKVQAANGTKFAFTTGNDVSQLLPFFYQNNATILNENQTAAGINTAAAIETLEFIQSWYTEGLASKEVFVGSESGEELFKQGIAPVVITFSGNVSQFKNEISTFQFGATYMPKKEMVANKTGGYNIVAFNNTKHPEEVKQLMDFLTSKEQLSAFCGSKGVIASRVSAQEITDYGNMSEELAVMMAEVNNVPSFAVKDYSLPQYLSYKSIITSEIQLVILGEKDAATAVKDMEEQINRSVFK